MYTCHAGDDAKLRIWEAKKCTLLRTVVLECASQAVAYSPDGRFIAIGLGNSNHEKEKTRSTAKTGAGGFIILCTKKYAIVHQARDSKEAIRTMKFSPDSKFLAMGSFDAQIYTYSVEDNFVKKVFISGVHMAPVVNLDYSVTGEYILSVDSTRRMVFTEASTGAHIASAAVLRDEKWSTWSSPVGWSIQGLWLSQPKGCDPCSAQRSFNGQLLATGNTGGKIYLSNYPCQSQAGFASSGGHAGPVSRICWLPGDSSLISIGQKDYSIFQWKVQYADTRESGDEGGLSVNECSAAENEIGFECQNTNEEQFESMELTSKYSVICPPSNPKVADDSPPNLDTRLEYVHGVRISDCRQNIRYNNDGNLVFISVTVGIVFSRAEQSQLVYTGHNKALISFDVDGSGSLAASGEQGSSPEVHIWDARTASEIAQFKNLHKRGVGSIAFAPSGEYLVTMGMDMMHSIVVLRSPSKRWTDGHIQCSASVSRRRMLWCAYLENNEYPIAVGGSHAMCFFKFRGRSVERQKGMFGRRKKIQPLLCATVTQYEVDGKLCDSVITGTVSGHIYAWYDRRIAKSVSGHDNAITSIAGISKGDFATGCRDGHIKIWNSYLEPQRSLQVSLFSPQPESFACHALRVNGIGSRLTIGMKSGELYEISLATKTYSQLADGHSHMKLRGLAVNPLNTDIYATCGDDGAVRIWSSSSRKCLQTASFDSACSCLAYSSDSSRLLIGTGGNDTQPAKDGVVIILDSESLESLSKERIAKHGIESIRFSPTGEIFAMASRDGIGYIYDFDTLSLKQTLSTKRANHKCIFGFIDFSEDGSVIRFAPNYVELFYFDVESGEAITETSMTKDLFWDTYTCPNTWMTQGIARPASEEAPIIAVTLNQKRTLVAVSYADGAVRIYRYPCLTQTSGYVHVPGLATYSSQLGFSAEDKNLIVLDTLTRSVMQYIITYK
jgi:WD40 repeat protein